MPLSSWQCSLCHSQRKRIVSWRLRTPRDWAGRGPALWPCAPTGFVGCLSTCSKSLNRPQKHRSVKWKAEVNWKINWEEGKVSSVSGRPPWQAEVSSPPPPVCVGTPLLGLLFPSPAYTLGAVGEGTATTCGPDSALQNQESWSTQPLQNKIPQVS